MARKRSWRVSPAQMEAFRNLASKYEGSHNFHNFTVSRDSKDRSNNRYMKSIEVRHSYFSKIFTSGTYATWFQVADPVVYGDTEWVSVLFHGQSFMLDQVGTNVLLVLAV